MKRLFYLLIGLVLLPALLYAQGSLSLKDINDNLTNNYYTKTVSDSKYATSTDISAKADKTYVDANFATTAENALKQNIADMVDYYTKTAADLLLADKADTDSVYTKTAADILLGLKADLTYVNATDEAILLDNDSQDVTIESNRVGVASLEVGLQTHQNKATGAHTATAISTTSWDNVQTCLDSLETAIQSIVVGSGFALESWVNSTLETNFYNKTQTDDTIAAAIAAIPTTDLSNYYTKAQTESTVAVMINDNAQAKYWYPANMANGDWTGEVIVATVSASQTQYNAVYMKSDGWAAAKADAYTTLPAIGIILETGTGSKKVLVKGIVKNTSWSFTQGQRIYVSAATAGAITSTAPTTTGQLVQIIGIALAADTIYVCPDTTCVEN